MQPSWIIEGVKGVVAKFFLTPLVRNFQKCSIWLYFRWYKKAICSCWVVSTRNHESYTSIKLATQQVVHIYSSLVFFTTKNTFQKKKWRILRERLGNYIFWKQIQNSSSGNSNFISSFICCLTHHWYIHAHIYSFMYAFSLLIFIHNQIPIFSVYLCLHPNSLTHLFRDMAVIN